MLNMTGEHGQTASGHVQGGHKRGQPAGHVWTRPVLTRSCSGHVEVTFGPCCSPAPDVTIVASNVAWNITCSAVMLQRGQAAGQVQTWPLHNCTKKCEKLWFLKKKGKSFYVKHLSWKHCQTKQGFVFVITVTLIPFWNHWLNSILNPLNGIDSYRGMEVGSKELWSRGGLQRAMVRRWAPKSYGGGVQRAMEVDSKELTLYRCTLHREIRG